MAAFDFISPRGADLITLAPATTPGGVSAMTVAGTSGGVAFESLTLYDVTHVRIDTAAHDQAGADDDTVSLGGSLTDVRGLTQLTLWAGSGANLLDVGVHTLSVLGAVQLDGETSEVQLSGGAISAADLQLPLGIIRGYGTIAGSFVNRGLVVGEGPQPADGIQLTGAVSGSGDYDGNILFSARYSPGNGPVEVDFFGNVTFGPSATLSVEIGGPLPGADYDCLNVTDWAARRVDRGQPDSRVRASGR